MKLLTSFTKLITGEGVRISYTYSGVDGDGKLTKHIDAIDGFIEENYLTEAEEK